MHNDTAETRARSTVLPVARRLLLILVVALAVRSYLLAASAMISRDGCVFIWYAQGLAEHPLETLRAQPHHPLYPALVLGAHAAIGRLFEDPIVGWQASAEAVALLAGLAAVLAMYLLAAELFDRRVALVAAACMALLPDACQWSADALGDLPHLALYVTGLALAARGLRRRTVVPLGAAAAFSGLAFLVRPEGGEVGIILAAGILLAGGWSWRRRAATLVLVTTVGLGVAIPYMLATGAVVKKKSIQRMFFWSTSKGAATTDEPTAERGRATHHSGRPESTCRGGSRPFPAWRHEEMVCTTGWPASLGWPTSFRGGGHDDRRGMANPVAQIHPPGIASAADVPVAIGSVAYHWARVLRVMYLLAAFAYLLPLCRRAPDGTAWRCVAGAAALHFAVLVALLLAFDYWELFSRRHVLVLGALTLPFSAAGLTAIVDTTRERISARPLGLWVVTWTIVVVPTLPWMLRPPYRGDAYLRETADWIADHYPPGRRILTSRSRVAFYCGGEYLQWLEPLGLDALLAAARGDRPDLVVLDAHRLEPGFLDALHARAVATGLLTLVHTSTPPPDEGNRRSAMIYAVAPTSGTPEAP